MNPDGSNQRPANLQRWGATEFAARGQDGMVTLIWCHVPRRQAGSVTNEALDLDPEAFVTAESVRLFQGGWRA